MHYQRERNPTTTEKQQQQEEEEEQEQQQEQQQEEEQQQQKQEQEQQKQQHHNNSDALLSDIAPSPRKQRYRHRVIDQEQQGRAAVFIQRRVRMRQLERMQHLYHKRVQQHQLHANILYARKLESAIRTIQAAFRAKQRSLDVKSMVLASDVVKAMPGTVQGRSGWYNMQGMIVELQIKGGHNWKITRGPCNLDEWEKLTEGLLVAA